MAKHLKNKKKKPKKINILKTNLNYHKMKIINYQIYNKQRFDTLYHNNVPVIWKLDFLLCNQCSRIREDIFRYTSQRILLISSKQEKYKNFKKINFLRKSVKSYREKLINHQINDDLNK